MKITTDNIKEWMEENKGRWLKVIVFDDGRIEVVYTPEETSRILHEATLKALGPK